MKKRRVAFDVDLHTLHRASPEERDAMIERILKEHPEDFVQLANGKSMSREIYEKKMRGAGPQKH
jgi:hypothetical protein